MLRIGHRGAMGYEPENTLRSFKKALQLGVDMIELDAMVCGSGEVVVFHDRYLKRTTNGRGSVSKKSLSDLKKLDVGEGEQISTLEEVLDVVNRKAKINIDLKGKRVLAPTVRIIDDYVRTKGWRYDDFILSSFDRAALRKTARLKQKIPIGVLVSTSTVRVLSFAKRINAYAIHVSRRLVSPKFVDDAHRKGFKILVWTINDKSEIDYLKKIGVDGIFSDFPDRV